MRTVLIRTNKTRLRRKLYLLLAAEYEIIDSGTADVTLTDPEDFPPLGDDDVILERKGGEAGSECFSFSHRELLSRLRQRLEHPEVPITMLPEQRCVILRGNKIKLTDVEYRLLDALMIADGFVSRRSLMRKVWSDECDSGVLNVYVHYLREKLEVGGEKIIISSRREGYRIDRRYRRDSNA